MKKQDKVSRNWRTIIILSSIAIVAILAQSIIREIVLFNSEITSLSDTLNAQIEEDLHNEVGYRVSELNDIYENFGDIFLDRKETLYRNLLFPLEQSIVLLDSPTDQEQLDHIIDVVEEYSVNEVEHDFLVMNSSGVLKYNSETDETLNIETINEQDDFNRYYISDLIEGIDDSDNNFYKVDVYKMVDGETMHAIYVGAKVEGTDYYIYTICYYDNIMEKFLREYSNDLSDYYSGHERNIFIIKPNGDLYVMRNPEFMGYNVSELDDEVAKNAVNTMLSFHQESTEGIFRTDYYRDLSETEVSQRIVYIEYIEELDMIVGTSRDSLKYDIILSDFQSENIMNSIRLLVPIYIVVIILLLIVTNLIIKNNKESMALVKEEEDLYHLFADITQDIIIITAKNGDIIFTNKLGKDTIYKEDEQDKVLNLDNIMVDEEGYKVLVGAIDNIYIKYSVSQVTYQGEECDLYIVDNDARCD